MKRILLIAVLLLASLGDAAAQFTYKWTPVPMDSTWDAMKDFRATKVIEKYSAQVAPLQEIIGYSEDEYDKARPESGLSNFAADVVRAIAEKKTGETVDMEAFYKANRYGYSGAYVLYNLKSVTITSKGTTYASVSGMKVRFPQGGKAVVKLDAQYLVSSTG